MVAPAEGSDLNIFTTDVGFPEPRLQPRDRR